MSGGWTGDSLGWDEGVVKGLAETDPDQGRGCRTSGSLWEAGPLQGLRRNWGGAQIPGTGGMGPGWTVQRGKGEGGLNGRVGK